MKKFTLPADGQWHTLPGDVIGILANTRWVEIDLLPDGTGRAINHHPDEEMVVEYTSKETT